MSDPVAAGARGHDADLTTADLTAPPVQRSGTVATALLDARRGLHRLTPVQAWQACQDGAVLIDTRTDVQREQQGELPGALVIDRTVLEWRLDPTSNACILEASTDLYAIVVCRQGYSSSLAAASLQAVGLPRATDLIGGVEAWIAAGLPLQRGPADVRV